MSETIPPLPDLEIVSSTKKVTDQATVDRVLRIIHKRRPDLLARIAEQEKKDLGIRPISAELNQFLKEEVEKEDLPNVNVVTSVTREIRRRVRVMYGLPI